VGVVVELQEQLIKVAGKPKKAVTLHLPDPEMNKAVRALFEAPIKAATKNPDKLSRQEAVEKLMTDAKAAFAATHADKAKDVKAVLEQIEVEAVRGMIANDGIRNPYRSVLEVDDAQGNILEQATTSPACVSAASSSVQTVTPSGSCSRSRSP